MNPARRSHRHRPTLRGASPTSAPTLGRAGHTRTVDAGSDRRQAREARWLGVSRLASRRARSLRDRWRVRRTRSRRRDNRWPAKRSSGSGPDPRCLCAAAAGSRGRRPRGSAAEEAAHPRCHRHARTGGRCACAALTGRHRATVWKVLKRHGVSRRRAGSARRSSASSGATPARCCTSTPTRRRSSRAPGIGVTGDRDKNGRARGLGKTVVIAVQDDHSRLVYAELHGAENAANVSVTLTRGAAWMREQGCQARSRRS